VQTLRPEGYAVGIAGNQPSATEHWLRAGGASADIVTSSATLGMAKPDLAFFRALCDLCGQPPRRVAYVGDRVDYDVLPAAAAGITAVLVRRGPWGVLQSRHADASAAALVVDSLDGLADRLAALPG